MHNQFNKVIYQIYPRSFQDSNGDGIGDINGVRNRLSYLSNLGVDMIWLTPIYPSPGRDNGYDISDYYSINPLFGTMEDFKALVKEAKELDMGIMLDMVLNHTSTEHEWFQKALEGDPKYMDYYIFKDTPTNWESKFGGNAWEYVESLDKYYLHLFDVMQADLNWDNPEVRKEMQNIVNYWIDLGVEGLRFDVINLISKPLVFKDSLKDGREMYTDGRLVHEYLRELNLNSFGKKDIVTVGELSSTSVEQACIYADPKNHELSTVFGFHHLKIDYKDNQKWALQEPDYALLKRILKEWQEGMESHDAIMALFWCNHDQPRIVSRFGDDINYSYESASVFATLMHMLKGMPYIYQGEEIGLPNAYFEELDEYKDVESINYAEILLRENGIEAVLEIIGERSRDNGRTPIPWDDTPNFGFTTGEPWLGFSKHPNLRTVKDQLADKQSIFYYYKSLIELRHNHEIVSKGKVEWIDSDDKTFHFKRTLGNEEWLVLNNLTKEKTTFIFDRKYNVVLSNYFRNEVLDEIILEPYESIILSKNTD